MDLNDELKIGNKSFVSLVLKPLTAGDALDAAEASEKVQLTINMEPVIVSSPTRATAERCRRQVAALIAKDGERLPGPITLDNLRALTEQDYLKLVDECDAVDKAYMVRESGAGGRGEGAATGSDPDGADTE